VSVPLWVRELAAGFWAEAGYEEPFPRELRRAIGRAVLPLTVVPRPALCVAEVLDWLRRAGVACALGEPDRPLRGCLVASRGYGFAFIDAEDSADEQRFSLAHELAHFLRDYLQPRRRAAARLGPQVLEVLDAVRPPRPEERLHALLRGAPIGSHVHLMARHPGGTPEPEAAAEREADRLAYELLAPADLVRAAARTAPDADEALRVRFGLPPAQAADYAALLFPPPPSDPLMRRLRAAGAHLSLQFGHGTDAVEEGRQWAPAQTTSRTSIRPRH
jgi:hypothetical protein